MPNKSQENARTEERKLLFNADLEESKQFDTYILTLAGGSFGLSLIFIQQVAPTPIGWTIKFLIIAWAAFGMSILSTLVSFLLSQRACKRNLEILDKEKSSEDEGKNISAEWTERLNWASMSLFVTGFIFLILFSAINLSDKG